MCVVSSGIGEWVFILIRSLKSFVSYEGQRQVLRHRRLKKDLQESVGRAFIRYVGSYATFSRFLGMTKNGEMKCNRILLVCLALDEDGEMVKILWEWET